MQVMHAHWYCTYSSYNTLFVPISYAVTCKSYHSLCNDWLVPRCPSEQFCCLYLSQLWLNNLIPFLKNRHIEVTKCIRIFQYSYLLKASGKIILFFVLYIPFWNSFRLGIIQQQLMYWLKCKFLLTKLFNISSLSGIRYPHTSSPSIAILTITLPAVKLIMG